MDEKRYRSQVNDALARIEKAFEAADPDVAECEASAGALTITLLDRFKIIVSPQPSQAQIWLAVSSEGKAYRFNFDAESKLWVNEHGSGADLFGQISQAVTSVTKMQFSI